VSSVIKAWDLLESKKLFTARDEDGDLYDAAHLAQLIAALGLGQVSSVIKIAILITGCKQLF
jgi:hypothetical protein